MNIPVLSLWQPWATAMALRFKKNETRSWSTGHRGWLGIHAAKRPMTKEEARMIDSNIWLQRPMPFGALVCIVRLVGCEKTERIRNLLSEREEWWGDYSDGRYAWITSPLDMIELPEPIPLVGHQGLFIWQVPEDLEGKLVRFAERPVTSDGNFGSVSLFGRRHMKYESKFDIDQVVWMVRSERFEQIVKCSPCKNTGKVKIGDEEFICPKCGGRSAHTQYVGEKFYIYGSSAVGQVRIEDYPGRYRTEEPNPKFEYMLYETGIGSGQIWKQENLFATEEEAQRYCDGHNGLLPAHEAVMKQAPINEYGRVRVE